MFKLDFNCALILCHLYQCNGSLVKNPNPIYTFAFGLPHSALPFLHRYNFASSFIFHYPKQRAEIQKHGWIFQLHSH